MGSVLVSLLKKGGEHTQVAKAFNYTPAEMQQRIDTYFDDCAEAGKKPTVPGLCLRLGITVRQYTLLLQAYNDETEREGRRSLQLKHLAQLERAKMRMTDLLENDTSSMAMLRLKQSIYGGYSGRAQEEDNGTVNVAIKLKGLPEGVSLGD